MGFLNHVTGLWEYCFSRSSRLSVDSTYLTGSSGRRNGSARRSSEHAQLVQHTGTIQGAKNNLTAGPP
jgi:hypothetical protein